MPYARDAPMEIGAMQRRPLEAREAAWLEAPVGELWLVIDGLRRRAASDVLAHTRLYVPPPAASPMR